MCVCVCLCVEGRGVESGRAIEYTLIVHILYQYMCRTLSPISYLWDDTRIFTSSCLGEIQ